MPGERERESEREGWSLSIEAESILGRLVRSGAFTLLAAREKRRLLPSTTSSALGTLAGSLDGDCPKTRMPAMIATTAAHHTNP